MSELDRYPVIDRTYELIRWYLPHLAKFQRTHRYGLGKRIEDELYDVMKGLVSARYASPNRRSERLSSTNERLQMVRLLTRLANEIGLLPHKSYEHSARELLEIGKMVGGWTRQQNQLLPSSPD